MPSPTSTTKFRSGGCGEECSEPARLDTFLGDKHQSGTARRSRFPLHQTRLCASQWSLPQPSFGTPCCDTELE